MTDDPKKLRAMAAALFAIARPLLAAAKRLTQRAEHLEDPFCYCGHQKSSHRSRLEVEDVDEPPTGCQHFDFGGDCACIDFQERPCPT
jgi:hypothetical protein